MAQMKAVQMHKFGDTDVLVYEDTIRPEAQAGEVLVRVRAAGVNPVDWKTRRGPGVTSIKGPQPFPYILGWAISGEVVALGEGVTQFAPGDAVYGMVRFPQEGKAYAEYVAAPVSDIALKPQRLSHQEAAAVPLAALTAWQAIFDTAHLQPGQTILIHAAAGGVGHLAVQLAKWKGAKVIATTSARNAEFVRDLGADTIIDYTAQPFEEAVRDVDVVFNTVSNDIVKRSFQVIKHGGFLVSIAGEHEPAIASSHGVQAARIMVHTQGEQMAELTRIFDAGSLKVHVDAVFPLQEVGQSHRLSEGGHVRGKIVLDVSKE
jgi:NADPH2:quinone reductase